MYLRILTFYNVDGKAVFHKGRIIINCEGVALVPSQFTLTVIVLRNIPNVESDKQFASIVCNKR